jgi:hypothetical protein
MMGPGLRFAGLPFLHHGEGQPFDRHFVGSRITCGVRPTEGPLRGIKGRASGA